MSILNIIDNQIKKSATTVFKGEAEVNKNIPSMALLQGDKVYDVPVQSDLERSPFSRRQHSQKT